MNKQLWYPYLNFSENIFNIFTWFFFREKGGGEREREFRTNLYFYLKQRSYRDNKTYTVSFFLSK